MSKDTSRRRNRTVADVASDVEARLYGRLEALEDRTSSFEALRRDHLSLQGLLQARQAEDETKEGRRKRVGEGEGGARGVGSCPAS